MGIRVLGAGALVVSVAVHLIEWVGGSQPVRRAALPRQRGREGGDRGSPAPLDSLGAAFTSLRFGAATLGAFITLLTTLGLLGVHSSRQGFHPCVAAVAELVCIVTVGWLLLSAREDGSSAVRQRRQHRPA